MTRTRTSARKAGSAFESLVVAYLARNGSKDRGDVSGPRHARNGPTDRERSGFFQKPGTQRPTTRTFYPRRISSKRLGRRCSNNGGHIRNLLTEAGLDGAPRDGRRDELEVFLAERGCTPLHWIQARAALKGLTHRDEVIQ